MEGLSLDALIRRKESYNALKKKGENTIPEFLGHGPSSHLPEAPAVAPDTNQLEKFKAELLQIDRRKKEHLTVTGSTGGPKGGFLRSGFLNGSTILVVILFSVSGGLFFAGGYLFSYNRPPALSGLAATSSPVNEQEKPDWRLGTVVEGTMAAQDASITPAYMARREYLEQNETLAERVAGDSENRMKLAAQNEAKRIVTKTTNDIKYAVRGVVGQSISKVFNPLAESVVGNTVGAAIQQAIPAKEGPPGTVPETVSGDQGAKGLMSVGGSAGVGPAQAQDQPQAQTQGQSQVQPQAQGQASASAAGGAPLQGAATSGVSGGVSTSPVAGSTGPMADLFALEVKSFVDSTEAYVFMNKLKENGYSATYIVRARAGSTIVYKVRVGNFANYADASQARQNVGYPCRVVLATPQDDPLRYGGGQ